MRDLSEFIFESDPEEYRALSKSVRKFAESRIAKLGSDSLSYAREDFTRMADLGLCGVNLPEHIGGADLNPIAAAAAIYELAREDLGPAIYLSVHLMTTGLVYRWCKEPDQHEGLRELACGKKLAAFCLTEAQAGSDAAALRTKAERTAEGYKINGEKIYITSGGFADLYLVFARSSEDRTKGISAFLVDAKDEGISFGPAEKKMGCEGSPISSVLFNNCFVPRERLLGREGDGYKIALSGLSGGRVNIGAAACGLAAKAILLSAEHAKQRRQFNRSISEFQRNSIYAGRYGDKAAGSSASDQAGGREHKRKCKQLRLCLYC